MNLIERLLFSPGEDEWKLGKGAEGKVKVVHVVVGLCYFGKGDDSKKSSGSHYFN